MFTVIIESAFRASHGLTFKDGSREDLHTHDWRVTAAVQAHELDAEGLVMDFHLLERLVKGVLDPMDGCRLEETGLFDGRNVSAEAVARYIYDCLSPKMPPDRMVAWVEVTEAPNCRARYSIG